MRHPRQLARYWRCWRGGCPLSPRRPLTGQPLDRPGLTTTMWHRRGYAPRHAKGHEADVAGVAQAAGARRRSPSTPANCISRGVPLGGTGPASAWPLYQRSGTVCRNASTRQCDTDRSHCDLFPVLRVSAQTENMDVERRRAVVVARAQCDGPGVSGSIHDLTPPSGLWYSAVQLGPVLTRRLADAGRPSSYTAGRESGAGLHPWLGRGGVGWPRQARHQRLVQRSATASAPVPFHALPGDSVPSLPASAWPRRREPGRGT